MKRAYLTVTAQPDDEILGFGASAYKLSKKGNKIYNCILSGSVGARVNILEIEVLKEHTSLVGHRPNVKSEVDLYTNAERGLLSVRPGITDFSSI